MKNVLLSSSLVLLVGLVFFLSSCGSDNPDPIAKPTASFTSVLEGKTVTFTNTSTNGETYSWDFGDGETAATESPSHTYVANGTYVVKLTTTNASGNDESSAALEVINVTIDGNFSEWADVAAVNNTGTGSITEVKIDNLAKDKLYVYIKGTSEMTSFFDLFLDLDYDASGAADTTGFIVSLYPAVKKMGADVLFEGFFGSTQGRADFGMFYGVFHADAGNDFGARDEPTLDANMIAYSELVSVDGGFALEFSIDLSFVPSGVAVNDNIQIFIDEWDNGVDGKNWWGAFSGHFPTQGEDDSSPIVYTFK